MLHIFFFNTAGKQTRLENMSTPKLSFQPEDRLWPRHYIPERYDIHCPVHLKTDISWKSIMCFGKFKETRHTPFQMRLTGPIFNKFASSLFDIPVPVLHVCVSTECQGISPSPQPSTLAPENSGAIPLACSNIGLKMNIPGSDSGNTHTSNGPHKKTLLALCIGLWNRSVWTWLGQSPLKFQGQNLKPKKKQSQ
jgi:hypothetical protein